MKKQVAVVAAGVVCMCSIAQAGQITDINLTGGDAVMIHDFFETP